MNATLVSPFRPLGQWVVAVADDALDYVTETGVVVPSAVYPGKQVFVVVATGSGCREGLRFGDRVVASQYESVALRTLHGAGWRYRFLREDEIEAVLVAAS